MCVLGAGDCQGVFVNLGDFSLEGSRYGNGAQAYLRKSKTPRKSSEKWT